MGGFPPPHITWWIGTRQLQPQQTVTKSSPSSLFVHREKQFFYLIHDHRRKSTRGWQRPNFSTCPISLMMVTISHAGHQELYHQDWSKKYFVKPYLITSSQGASWRCYGGESGRHVGDQSALWVKNIFYLNFSLWVENLSQTSLKSLCVWEPRWIQTTSEQVNDDDYEWRRWWTIFLLPGNDVYFECEVRANPIPHKLIWLHNVSFWEDLFNV